MANTAPNCDPHEQLLYIKFTGKRRNGTAITVAAADAKVRREGAWRRQTRRFGGLAKNFFGNSADVNGGGERPAWASLSDSLAGGCFLFKQFGNTPPHVLWIMRHRPSEHSARVKTFGEPSDKHLRNLLHGRHVLKRAARDVHFPVLELPMIRRSFTRQNRDMDVMRIVLMLGIAVPGDAADIDRIP